MNKYFINTNDKWKEQHRGIGPSNLSRCTKSMDGTSETQPELCISEWCPLHDDRWTWLPEQSVHTWRYLSSPVLQRPVQPEWGTPHRSAWMEECFQRVHLVGPTCIVFHDPRWSAVTRNTKRVDSPEGEGYARKYPREAKVKERKIPVRRFGKNREEEEDGKSNVSADYL